MSEHTEKCKSANRFGDGFECECPPVINQAATVLQPALGQDVEALRHLIRRFVTGQVDANSMRYFAIQWGIIPDPDIELKKQQALVELKKTELFAAQQELRRLEGL